MTCKGICIRHKADSNNYANGQKRCQICDRFIKWNGLSCPGYRLRNGPRLFKHKAKLRMKQKGQQIRKAQNENSSNIILHVQ